MKRKVHFDIQDFMRTWKFENKMSNPKMAKYFNLGLTTIERLIQLKDNTFRISTIYKIAMKLTPSERMEFMKAGYLTKRHLEELETF